MSTMFRSVPMSYLQILIPAAVSEEFVDHVGRMGFLQFTDLNEDIQPFQRHYTKDVIRIQEIERQVKGIEDLLTEYKVRYNSGLLGEVEAKRQSSDPQLVDTIAAEINDAFRELREQVTAEKQLAAEYEQEVDKIEVLTHMEQLLAAQHVAQNDLVERQVQKRAALYDGDQKEVDVPLRSAEEHHDVGFRYVAGVIRSAQRISFERQVFLTTRGNSFLELGEITDEGKIPFVVFFMGTRLDKSIHKLCGFMGIQIVYTSSSRENPEELIEKAHGQRLDFQRIHQTTRDNLRDIMRGLVHQLLRWRVTLFQERYILVQLNKFKRSDTYLRAEGWCPANRVDEAQMTLDLVIDGRGLARAPVMIEQTNKTHPTYFETNEFTEAFQNIVDTYGVPRYREFNPAVPTMITFPFLFGIMYGDMFHGSVLLLTGLVLILMQDRLRGRDLGELAGGLFYGRWILLFMGISAVYCGCIYNDVMSIMINGWNKTQWVPRPAVIGTKHVVFIQQTGMYDFGIDPAWHATPNELQYANSLKMKLSVIVGVTQMSFGLLIKLTNHINENDRISIYFEFIPQFIFMMVFFGYMIFMIIFKWTVNWANLNPPSLISTLIGMILSVGKVVGTSPLYNLKLQETIQQAFVFMLVLCIPWMLFPKPFLLRYYHNKEVEEQQYGVHEDIESQPLGAQYGQDESKQPEEPKGSGGHGEEEWDFSEVFIHQMIHTIEYVLGTVSNTASYLRLWALSLAHSELSGVFFDKTIKGTIAAPSAGAVLTLVAGTFMFFMFTIAVLLVMDVLECFLHALRLHWVEFQNKFYYADGIPFEPFSYEKALETEKFA